MSIRHTSLLLIACLTGLALPSRAFAEDGAPMDRFDCPGLYRDGDFLSAAACFESQEIAGKHDGPLLYNLGNSYYRAGEVGRAILAYRRAALFLPRDADLRANLDFARNQRADDLEPPDERSPMLDTLLAPYDTLSRTQMLLLGLGAWVVLFGLLSYRLVRPLSTWKLPAAGLAFIALFGLIGASARSYQTEHHPIAVVLVPEVTVRSGQDPHSTDLVRLHAGAEIKVVERGESYMQVALSTGTRGWLRSEALGLVQPLPESRD